MTAMNLTKDETQLINMARAIRQFGKADLIQEFEAGELLIGLKSVYNLDTLERDLKPSEIKILLLGFVGGVAAVAGRGSVSEPIHEIPHYIAEDDPSSRVVAGGPSSGVVAGQVEGDPRYVRQSGPRPDQEAVES